MSTFDPDEPVEVTFTDGSKITLPSLNEMTADQDADWDALRKGAAKLPGNMLSSLFGNFDDMLGEP